VRGKTVYIDVENAERFINAIKSGWRVLTLPDDLFAFAHRYFIA
jgi:hypothetical protein